MKQGEDILLFIMQCLPVQRADLTDLDQERGIAAHLTFDISRKKKEKEKKTNISHLSQRHVGRNGNNFSIFESL